MFDDRAEVRQHQIFNRRAILLFGAQLGVAGALGARLYQLQLVENQEYSTLAEENRVNLEPLAPERGEIRDRNGRPIAVNRPNYRIMLVKERIEDLEETLGRLRRLTDLSDWEIGRFMGRLKRTSQFVPVPVKENLSWDAFARVNANAPALRGVLPRIGWVRDYPERDALAHVVGYVGAVTDKELREDQTDDPLIRMPEARIGKNGVERSLERSLRGTAGQRRFEVNAGGREIRELSRQEGRGGEDVRLTIDLDLQRYAMGRIEGESAAVVLMDVRNGDLLALASAPAFDPNKFVFGISHADWNALRDDEYDPLRDKAAAGAYPPGSTFKLITALAALHYGEFDPEETVLCTGKIQFGDRDFHCWRRQGHGLMNFRDAMKESCDVYYYEAAKRVGVRRLAEVAAAFGIGEAPQIEIPNVKRGNMPTPEWLMEARGERWSGGETLNVGIGQGALLTTPLQLAVMAARLANGREKVTPRLIAARGGAPEPAPEFEKLDFDPEHIALTQDAMQAAANEERGTAYKARIADPVNALAGKTGTAQVRRITVQERETGVRKNEELPWRLRDHALYVAYAPLKAPRYAVSVVVEHGGSGSKAAAPVARDVLMRALWRGEPPLEAFPPEAREEEAARRAASRASLGGWDEGAGPLRRPG
ncbi:MAG: penicillin-binding protein 2 [Pseudomonadota bacterium]